jgi:hypothetical protein
LDRKFPAESESWAVYVLKVNTPFDQKGISIALPMQTALVSKVIVGCNVVIAFGQDKMVKQGLATPVIEGNGVFLFILTL